jgi:hypothetical protein
VTLSSEINEKEDKRQLRVLLSDRRAGYIRKAKERTNKESGGKDKLGRSVVSSEKVTRLYLRSER